MGGKEKEGRVGGRGKRKGGERGEDVEGPGKWSAPGPVLALGGPAKDCQDSRLVDFIVRLVLARMIRKDD